MATAFDIKEAKTVRNNYKNILAKLGIKSTFGLTIEDIIEGIRWQDHEV